MNLNQEVFESCVFSYLGFVERILNGCEPSDPSFYN